MKQNEKRKLLATFIELHVQCGYDIVPYMGKPLSHFDTGKVREHIERLRMDREDIGQAKRELSEFKEKLDYLKKKVEETKND